jgi:ABC-type branched-subunit amino acid transport system substrate-binding protein
MIGSHQPLSGIAAPGYDEIAPASKAYFDYIDAHGGINGRSINYKYLDDAYDPAHTAAVVSTLVQQDKIFALFNGFGTPTHQQVVRYLNENGVPDLFVASGCKCWNKPSTQPYTFGWQPDYVIEGKILGAYVAKHFAGQKIAIFAQGDAFGRNGIKGLEHEVPASDIAATEYYDPASPTVATQVAALQQSGANIVVSFSVPAYTALLQLAALRLNYRPQLVVSSAGSDPTSLMTDLARFSQGAAPAEKLIQGMVTDDFLAPLADENNSWVQLFDKIRHQYLPKYPLDGNVEYGMAAAYTFAQALEAAGQNPTRASIVSAIESSHFVGPGLTPFAYSTSSHAGYTGAQIAIVSGQAAVTVGQPMTTDDGSGPVTPYATPQHRAPADGIPGG